MTRRWSSVACSTASASFLAMFTSSSTPKPPSRAQAHTGPSRNTTCPSFSVSAPIRAAASTFTYMDTSHTGRPNSAARSSASTFFPVAFGPASSRCSPHSSAAAALSHTSLP